MARVKMTTEEKRAAKNASNSKHRLKNIEKIQAYQAEYSATHRESKAEYNAGYHEEHRAEKKAREQKSSYQEKQAVRDVAKSAARSAERRAQNESAAAANPLNIYRPISEPEVRLGAEALWANNPFLQELNLLDRKDPNSRVIFGIDATSVNKSASLDDIEEKMFLEGSASWTGRSGQIPMWKTANDTFIGTKELKTRGFRVKVLAMSDVSGSIGGSGGIEGAMQTDIMFQPFGTRTNSEVMGYRDQGVGKVYICYMFYHPDGKAIANSEGWMLKQDQKATSSRDKYSTPLVLPDADIARSAYEGLPVGKPVLDLDDASTEVMWERFLDDMLVL